MTLHLGYEVQCLGIQNTQQTFAAGRTKVWFIIPCLTLASSRLLCSMEKHPPLTFGRTCCFWLTAASPLCWGSSNNMIPSAPAHSSLHLILQELQSDTSSNLNFLCQWPPQKHELLSVECILLGSYTEIVFPQLGGVGGGTYFGGQENMLLLILKKD